MQNLQKRIMMLQTRAAMRRKKAGNLAAVRKLTAGADSDEALATKLELDYAKEKANEARKDDKHAKIVIGAGVLLLPVDLRASTLAYILPLLTTRDQTCLVEWFAARSIDHNSSVTAGGVSASSSAFSTPTVESSSHIVGQALRRTIDSMTEGELGLLIPEILVHANDEDRPALEAWLAGRTTS